MADIELVIKISEEDYFLINRNNFCRNKWKVYDAIKTGTLLSKGNKCKWIHYDYRTVCPREHDIDNPYWRIPEYRMDTLKYCPYCGKEIEIEADKEREVNNG